MADMFLDALAELDAEIDAVNQLRQQDRDAMGAAIKERADRLKTSRESVAPVDASQAPATGSAPTAAPTGTTDPSQTPSEPVTDPSAAPTDPAAPADPAPAAPGDDTGTAFGQ